MAYVHNIGVGCYKRGDKRKFNKFGVDESVWLENEPKLNKVNYKTNLYLLSDCDHEDVFKIGISSNPYLRCKTINSNCRYLHRFKVKDEIMTLNSELAYTLEQSLLKVFSGYRLYTKNQFCGSTEVIKIDLKIITKAFANIRKLI